ncbi:MAG TPA: hypothetical protein VFH43_05740 [Candidatus Kapabacteria bacterium]|nr:hypothetical protein [Candidatus Kapabacteria bacterium]
MQNRSYDRYVELLRAAELQSYERTSARFVATVGIATTGSWLARNPITSLIAAICTVAIITIVALTVGTEDQSVEPHHLQTYASGVESIHVVSPVSRARSVDADHRRKTIDVVTVQSEVASEISSTIEEGLKSADESEPLEAITTASGLPQRELTEIASNEVQSLRMISPESYHVDRVPHSWSISLTAQDLSALVKSKMLDFRATVQLESGHGFALGIAVGVRSRSERSSEFAGFKDTIFIIEGREYSSKIGQYRATESGLSFLEAGIAASYQFFGSSETARVLPEISVFAGLEGEAVVFEQSVGINWKLHDRFLVLGGVSVREYPLAERAVQLSPQLGLKALF